jgi:hypothetical protein
VRTQKFVSLDASTDYCNPRVILESQAGCPVFSANSFVRMLTDHAYLWGFCLIIFGILATFAGIKYFRTLLGLLSGGVTFLFIMTLMSYLGFLDYLDPYQKTGSIIITIISFCFALFIAGVVGVFTATAGYMVGIMILGMVSGLLVGVILYDLIFFSTDSFVLFLILSIGLAVVSTYLAFNYTESLVIYGTAFIGAYALVRGLSMFFGYFPNEYLVYNNLKHGVGIHIPW